jgi:hypothetical protein
MKTLTITIGDHQFRRDVDTSELLVFLEWANLEMFRSATCDCPHGDAELTLRYDGIRTACRICPAGRAAAGTTLGIAVFGLAQKQLAEYFQYTRLDSESFSE